MMSLVFCEKLRLGVDPIKLTLLNSLNQGSFDKDHSYCYHQVAQTQMK